MSSLISVIIPVYNAEPYLRRCIDSILAQNNVFWEAILIDDGSSDKSFEICNEYACRDKRIRVSHKKNGGVSSARNVGLDVANGDYVVFVDADDMVDEEFLTIDELEDDVIQKGHRTIDLLDNVLTNNHVLTEERIENYDILLRYYVNYRNNALWDKLISRKVIGNKRFREDVKIGEDFLFFLTLIPNIRSYKFSPKGNYLYRIVPGSASRVCDVLSRLQIIEENIEKIIECNKYLNNEGLVYSIVYKNYFPYLCVYNKQLTQTQKVLFRKMIETFSLKKIKYLSLSNKVKTMLRIVLSIFKR